MFYNDHAPPHFHARYAEYSGIIDIQELKMIQGNLPRRALELVLNCAEIYQSDLVSDWKLCQAKKAPNKIAPLK